MSVRDTLLLLLAEENRSVYQLKLEFERRTGKIWPMNIGQVYQTVQRLERDGLAKLIGTENDGNRQSDIYALTPHGMQMAQELWKTPMTRDVLERDYLVMRISVATECPLLDVIDIIDTQRHAIIKELQKVTKLLRTVNPAEDLASFLQYQRRIFDLESESRWLDHIEDHAASQQRNGPQSTPLHHTTDKTDIEEKQWSSN